MEKRVRTMESKKRLSKKAKIILAVIAALLVITAIVLTVVFVNMDKNHTALNKEEAKFNYIISLPNYIIFAKMIKINFHF